MRACRRTYPMFTQPQFLWQVPAAPRAECTAHDLSRIYRNRAQGAYPMEFFVVESSDCHFRKRYETVVHVNSPVKPHDAT